MSQQSIAIIGAGAIGLTCAIRLLEQGHPVTIFAKKISPETTSDIAAAYWSPDIATEGQRLADWTLASWARFQALTHDPDSGVTYADLYQLVDEPQSDFSALAAIHPIEPAPSDRFPAAWQGVRQRVAKIDTPIYMPWLHKKSLSMGAVIKQAEIERFESLFSDFQIILNCTGLAAKQLTGDTLYPIRGQVISVRRPPDMPDDIISAHAVHHQAQDHQAQDDTSAVTYIVPRSQDCLLGGTFQYHNGNQDVDMAIAEGILQRSAQFYPSLANVEILRHRVGLRPGRAFVRLESESLPNGVTILHNYGHAAYGHTLSWGCAEEVAKLVAEI